MSGLPLLFTAAGPVPTPPVTIQQNLIAAVQAIAPGYTASLPGSLIEDLSSTVIAAIAAIDQARVDAVNNVTPYASNPFILNQQGQMLGIPLGQPTNGNVDVMFTGTPGYIIPAGFLIGDGTNQYAIQDGGVIQSNGQSLPLEAIATNAGIFAIPANSVTTIVSSVASGYTLTVTNPAAGVPASELQTVESYRAQVIQANQVTLQNCPAQMRTTLQLVPGVSPRLISILQSGIYYEVIVGGGDPYSVANAIFQSVATPGLLAGAATLGTTESIPIFDAPNTYTIKFVVPAAAVVTGTSGTAITWNTELTNFTAAAAVNQYMQTAATSYINSIPVGQPINLLVLTQAIQAAVASVLSAVNLTTLVFTFNINGTPASVSAGTDIILSDPESYFTATPTALVVVQG